MKSVHFACWFVLVSTMALAQSDPAPLINQPLVPLNAAPGGPGFTLTVNGTGFVAGSTIEWDGSPRATTFVGGSQLTAVIDSADVATAGSFAVTVVNPGPGGGNSNAAYFAVTTPTIGPVFIESDFTSFGSANVAGDFNGDGKLDLAAAVYAFAGTILVHLGNSDGTFQTALTFATGPSPLAISTGDFNHDDKRDLVTANKNGTTSVLIGNGDGTFQTHIDYPTQRNSGSVAVGDFNGDGNSDLVVGQSNGGGVSVLLGNGDGTFQAQVVYPSGLLPYAVAVGDFNKDGRVDLAVADHADFGGSGGAVAVLLGNGDGTFQRPQIHGLGHQALSIVIADFNRDGNLDIVTGTDNNGSAAVLLGRGDGTFFVPQFTSASGCLSTMVVGDFDGDGILDLACSNSVHEYFLLGAGDGTFVSAHGFLAKYAGAVSAADFNNDGALDLGAGFGVLLQTTGTVSKTSLDFGRQTVGTASSSQAVLLRNLGATPLDISSIVISTNFIQTNNCGSSVPPRRSCTLNVSFAPT